MGLAWLASNNHEADLDMFCASMHYNTSGLDYSDIRPGEVPIIWCDTNADGVDYHAVARTVPRWYTGPVMILNEPGTPRQCDLPTPAGAATVYVSLAGELPAGAQLVAPNIIIQHQGNGVHGVGWLRLFIEEVARLQGGRANMAAIGIHFYGVITISPATKLGWVVSMLDAIGYGDVPIWISEYGVFNEGDPASIMTAITELNAHPRVGATFGYTPRHADTAIPFLSGSAIAPLTASGRGLFEGYRRLGFTSAWPKEGNQ